MSSFNWRIYGDRLSQNQLVCSFDGKKKHAIVMYHFRNRRVWLTVLAQNVVSQRVANYFHVQETFFSAATQQKTATQSTATGEVAHTKSIRVCERTWVHVTFWAQMRGEMLNTCACQPRAISWWRAGVSKRVQMVVWWWGWQYSYPSRLGNQPTVKGPPRVTTRGHLKNTWWYNYTWIDKATSRAVSSHLSSC